MLNCVNDLMFKEFNAYIPKNVIAFTAQMLNATVIALTDHDKKTVIFSLFFPDLNE